MRDLFLFFLWALTLALTAPATAAAAAPAAPAPAGAEARATRPLTLGVVPYLSARRIVQLYRPLQEQLEHTLKRPVRLVTATDYPTFLEKTARREYDLIATSPAFGRMAQLDAGYQPLLRPVNSMTVLLVVPADSPIRSPAALRGHTVATTDPLATLTLAGLRALREHGLTPGRDVTVHATNSHANSLAALQRGDVAAAFTSTTALRQVDPGLSARTRVLAELATTTPLLYLASPLLPTAQQEALRRAMHDFANGTEAGRRFVEALGHGGLAAVPSRDMSSLDPLLGDLRVQLEAPR